MKKGIIIKKISNKFWVAVNSEIFICSARGNLKGSGLFVGDNVVFSTTEFIIESVLERKNLLVRPPLANLEQMLIVLAYAPKPDYLILDKLLLFCEINEIKPVICVNKIDASRNENQYIQTVYGKFYQVLELSAHKKINIDKLKKVLKNNVSTFAGQSGVGKSALINSLFDSLKTIEGNLSEKIVRGKNTTRHVELYKISDNSYIADTPGFTALNESLLKVSYYELASFYPDFLEQSQGCKFTSCVHIGETNCMIKNAVSSGSIDLKRYERYVSIFNSLKAYDKNKYKN